MKLTIKLIIMFTAILNLCLISTSVWAGSKQPHPWEGGAIGFGVAIVGSTLIDHHAYAYQSGPSVAYTYNYRHTNRKHNRYSAGHHGHRKHYNGGHYTHRRYDRGHRYTGHYRHGNSHGNRHKGSWQSHGRRQHCDQRRHNRRHGGRRY